MAHCPYDRLNDLEPALAVLRTWPGLRETKPGIFYFRSEGFLHFHIDKEGRRWADVKTAPRGGWKEIPLLRSSRHQREAFLAAAEACYRAYRKAAGRSG